jgi:hypothetical protein
MLMLNGPYSSADLPGAMPIFTAMPPRRPCMIQVLSSPITLDLMPWLGQKVLAGQFAEAVGLALGQGNACGGLFFWARSMIIDR